MMMLSLIWVGMVVIGGTGDARKVERSEREYD